MTKQDQKIRVPSIRELVKWHKQFGRMLEPNEKRTKLFGVDGKGVEYIQRSRPEHFYFQDRIRDTDGGFVLDDSLGYSHMAREDGSRSDFRLYCPNGRDEFLTYAECDLVLGSNYDVIDRGYSSPGPRIRKILFKANENMASDYYNAFELGTSSQDDGITTDVIYYKIPQKRFRELRDYQTNIEGLVEAVRAERYIS